MCRARGEGDGKWTRSRGAAGAPTPEKRAWASPPCQSRLKRKLDKRFALAVGAMAAKDGDRVIIAAVGANGNQVAAGLQFALVSPGFLLGDAEADERADEGTGGRSGGGAGHKSDEHTAGDHRTNHGN